MEKAIEIQGLTKLYKNGKGIFDINIEVEKGDIFGFLGPNGAGKTTAMKIMTGLMHPDSGDVKIFGHSVLNDYRKAMGYVGCIIETAESFQYLTAYENLKMYLRYYPDIKKERIDECLEITGLIKAKNEKLKNFSLGMRQRLGLAAAILSKPEVLILDEPLNGLDVEGMLEVRKFILNQARENSTTFFISSHLIHDVELTCTKVAVIHSGEIVNIRNTEDILKNYSSLENFYISEVDSNGRI